MVLGAANEHGVFLGVAQTGQGLARVEQSGAGALERLDVFRGQRGHAGEVAEIVQDDALRAQQMRGRPLEGRDERAGGDVVALVHVEHVLVLAAAELHVAGGRV